MLKGSPELVRNWINKGRTDQAIAAYGNSVEFLERALNSGEIPWNNASTDQDLLSYQKKLLAKGGYLYFAFPLIDNMKSYNPKLARKLRNLSEYTDAEIRRSLHRFAAVNAITHHFQSYTKAEIDEPYEVVGLTFLLAPNLVRKYQDDTILHDFFHRFCDRAEWEESPNFGFENNLSLAQLREILTQSISRRGLIVYYNKGLLANRVIPGFEMESEIMVHTKKPLTLEVISGIEILGEADQQAVSDLIQPLEGTKS